MIVGCPSFVENEKWNLEILEEVRSKFEI